MSVARGVLSSLKGRSRSNITTMGVIGAVATAPFTYIEKKDEWGGTAAAAYAGAEAAGWIFAEPLMWGITLAGLAKAGGEMMVQEAKENRDARRNNTTNQYDAYGGRGGQVAGVGGQFYDSENASTMRQRQLMLMRQQMLSTETILGSEARQLHR